MSVLVDHESWYNLPGPASPEDRDGSTDPTEFADWQKHYVSQALTRYKLLKNQSGTIVIPGNSNICAGDRIILNGTDNGSSNADDSLLYEEATDDVGLVTGTAVDTFTFDGNAKVEGTMRASATGAIKVEGNTDDGILILDASASGVDVGSAIVFEEGTDDGAMALSGVTRLSNLESVERGVTAKTEISDGGSSKILDFNANQNFIINMNASLTLGQPVTGQVGQTGFIVFKQDASGSRTLTLNSAFKNPGGTAPTLTTTANGIDVIGYIISSPNEILLSTAQLAFA